MPRSKRKPAQRLHAQAESFRRSRRDRASEIAQDYVEAIADLSSSLGEARVTDLARRLGVTHVTVNRTLGRLQQAGYVHTKPYRAIFLTKSAFKRPLSASALTLKAIRGDHFRTVWPHCSTPPPRAIPLHVCW